jgi:hypothetical protein
MQGREFAVNRIDDSQNICDPPQDIKGRSVGMCATRTITDALNYVKDDLKPTANTNHRHTRDR